MNIFKKTFASLALASSLLAAAPAQAVLTNWILDTNGAAAGGQVSVSEFIDLTGIAYARNTFTSLSTFNFNEFGSFNAFSVDGVTSLSPALSATFFGTGTGTTGGALNFLTGTLNVFSGVDNIGTFNLLSGSANLAAGTVLPNGAISLIFQATALSSGYFFTGGLLDLSTLLPDTVLFGFGTTNASPVAGVVPTSLINGYNANFNPDVAVGTVADQVQNVYISNNGQFRLQIPEPGSMALLGIGLLGLALASRRKQA